MEENVNENQNNEEITAEEIKVEPQRDHVLSVELATKEVKEWIAYKQISERRQKQFVHAVRTMIEGFCLGRFVLDKGTKVITHKLTFGLGKDEHIKELKYQPRLKLTKINQSLKGVDPNDSDERVTAHIAALTGQLKAVVAELDSEDAVLAEAIASFFL